MHLHAIKYVLILACWCTTVADACAADAAGVVKTLKGTVHMERAGGVSGCASTHAARR
jgi:hypothetical protein